MSKLTEVIAEKFRRYCLDHDLSVAVMPRANCVRIMDKVTIDPEIDITIYSRDNLDVNNITTIQYHVIVKQDDKGEVSFIDACKIIQEVVESVNVR